MRALAAGRTGPDDPPQGVLMVNGAATDPNSAALEAGVADAFEGAPIEVLASYDTPDWSPDKAQEWVTGQLTQYAGRVDAVYAANDGTAGGAISAMKAAGLDPVPPVTGQDAELAAIQRIVAGDQYDDRLQGDQRSRRAPPPSWPSACCAARCPSPPPASQGVPSLLLSPGRP